MKVALRLPRDSFTLDVDLDLPASGVTAIDCALGLPNAPVNPSGASCESSAA